jgi:hypothetical protein
MPDPQRRKGNGQGTLGLRTLAAQYGLLLTVIGSA